MVDITKVPDSIYFPVSVLPTYWNTTLPKISFRDVVSEIVTSGTIIASDIPVTPTGNLTSTDVQAALEELQADIDGLSGSGDMLKSIYDMDDNGVVDQAESVPWAGVTGVPSSFPPSAHTHVAVDVTDFDTEVSNNTDVAANTAARHTHSNQATLDAITAAYTTAEQTKLSGIAAGAEVNVNADWNSVSGDSQILNKPTLATVATTGDYNDLLNLPSIPTQYTDELAQDAVGNILLDSESIDFTYNDATPSISASVLANTTVQKVEVSKNGFYVGARKRVNLIEGSNITLTITDDGANDETDITIAASGAGAHTHVLADITDAGTIASQDADSVNIDGGTIDSTVIGGTTPAAGSFTQVNTADINSTGDLLIDASTGKVRINGAASKYSLNVYGTGLNGRLFFQGAPGDNPGVELATDSTGDRRVLIRMNEAGTSGSELTFWTRASAGGNVVQNMTLRENGDLDVEGSITSNGSAVLTANQTITLSGDITGSGATSITTSIASDVVTNTELANMNANTIKGRNAGTAGDPGDFTVTDLTEETTPAAGDFLLGWNSTGDLRKFDVGDLPSGGGGSVATDAIWDAKGDLAVGTGANTSQRLAVGTNGQSVYADSTATTGIRWGAKSITPSQITSDQDNYNPTGWADANIVRLSGDSSIRAITSFTATFDGDIKTLINVGDYPIYIPGEHPDGTSTNRVITTKDIVIPPKKSIQLYYDGTSSRWRTLGEESTLREGKVVSFTKSVGSATTGDHFDATFLALSSGTVTTITSTSSLPNYYRLNTAAGTDSGYIIYMSKGTPEFTYFGSAHIYSEFFVSLPQLSDGTNTFTATWQITDTPSSSTVIPNNTVGIRYSHSINSGKFEGFSKDNTGAESPVDLGVTVATDQLYTLRIEIDKSNSEVRFYIDGVMCGRVTSNMPNSVGVSPRVLMIKTVGSAILYSHLHGYNVGAIYA